MKISIQFPQIAENKRIDSASGINLSQFINRNALENANAYFIPPASFSPIAIGSFVGSVALGGACNCEDITFNAHGNGTHTECVGHIAKELVYMPQIEVPLFCQAELIEVTPTLLPNGDHIIDFNSYDWNKLAHIEAIIIKSGLVLAAMQFSGTNPCYFDPAVTALLRTKGIHHLLTDLPSVDREEDGGALAAHKAFFNYPEEISLKRTITELLFIPAIVKQGTYILHFALAPFQSDAVPAHITIYPV